MKKTIELSQFLGFSITSLAGTILHFLYEWLGNAVWIAPFSGVNESTFEHMKILFWPLFIFAIVQSFFFRERENFWCIKLRGILLGITLIPVIFYSYNGVIGKSPDFINIAIFFICAAIVFVYETRKFSSPDTNCKTEKLSFVVLCVIGLCFVVFTFFPPILNIFKDPVTNTYGIRF